MHTRFEVEQYRVKVKVRQRWEIGSTRLEDKNEVFALVVVRVRVRKREIGKRGGCVMVRVYQA